MTGVLQAAPRHSLSSVAAGRAKHVWNIKKGTNTDCSWLRSLPCDRSNKTNSKQTLDKDKPAGRQLRSFNYSTNPEKELVLRTYCRKILLYCTQIYLTVLCMDPPNICIVLFLLKYVVKIRLNNLTSRINLYYILRQLL